MATISAGDAGEQQAVLHGGCAVLVVGSRTLDAHTQHAVPPW